MNDFFEKLINDIKKDFKFGWQATASLFSLVTKAGKTKKHVDEINLDVRVLKDIVEVDKLSIQAKINSAKEEIKQLKK